MVSFDVRKKLVSKDFATKVYGVVLDQVGEVDQNKTELLRRDMRMRFSAKSTLPLLEESASSKSNSQKAGRIGEYLEYSNGSIYCSKCGFRYCGTDEDPILHSITGRVATSELGPLFGEEGSEYEFFECYCPGCKVRFQSNVVELGRKITNDVRLSYS